MRQERAFISNNLDKLADLLEKQLASSDFFERKIIVVPNSDIKDWLLKRMAKSAVLGLEFVDAGSLGSFFSKWLFYPKGPDAKEDKLPSFLELKLGLEKALEENDFFQLPAHLKRGKKNKMVFLEELTALFLLYGLYLEKWEGWQKELFKRTGFTTPLKVFRKNLENMPKASFYFFGITYLPPIFRDVVRRLSKNAPVWHFCFSPCLYFWEDQLSDKEQKSMRKRLHNHLNTERYLEWDSYLKEQNPLLANFGKLLREGLKILDADEMEQEEAFVGNSEIENHFLKKIQTDLFFLNKTLAHKEVSFCEMKKAGIQLHAAPSKLREVQVLHEKILFFLKQGVRLSEIAVYAPQLELYIPYIKLVFENSLPYKFLEIEETDFERAIFDFFHLVQGSFQKEELLNLLKNPAFQKAHGYLDKEEKLWETWLDRLNVNFGLDEEHVAKKIDTKWPYQSFGYAFSRMAFSFACLKNDQNLSLLPGLTMNDASVFEKFLQIFKILEKEYLFFQTGPKMTLSKWADYLESWAEANLKALKPKEKAAFASFKNFCSILKEANAEGEFTLDAWFLDFKKVFLKKKASAGFSELETLQFASLKNFIPPQKVVCLLGLGETFPRQEKLPVFNLLEQNKTYVPLKNDQDRFSFLQSLLSASDIFYMSYVSLSEEDGKKALPSIIVQELFRYLDSFYVFNGQKPSSVLIYEHPSIPFDKSYFIKENFEKKPCEVFSLPFYLAAQNYYGLAKRPLSLAFLEKKEKTVLPEEINLKDLFLLGKNPLQFYFQKVLGFSLEKDNSKLFEINGLDLFLLRQEVLKIDLDKLLTSQLQNGLLPPGVMKKVLENKITKELETYLLNLKDLNLRPSAFFKIELNKNYQSLKKEKNLYLAPPLEVDFEGRKIYLTGEMSNLSEEGLVFHGVKGFIGQLSLWPQILVFLSLNEKYHLFKNQLIFTKKPAVADLALKDLSEALSCYLKYYESALTNFSFLYKGWARPLLDLDLDSLRKTLKSSFLMKEQDPYLSWLLTHSFLPEAEDIVQQRSAFLKTVFEPFEEFQQCRS